MTRPISSMCPKTATFGSPSGTASAKLEPSVSWRVSAKAEVYSRQTRAGSRSSPLGPAASTRRSKNCIDCLRIRRVIAVRAGSALHGRSRRQRDRKDGRPGLRAQRDVAAVAGHDPAHDVKAEARALAHALGGEERLEHTGLLLGRDAGAVVGDVDGHARGAAPGGDGDRPVAV